MNKIILASASPRRKELMGLLPLTFEIITKNIAEELDETLSPVENVMSLAVQKAKAVAQDYPERLVIGCDTIVVLDGQILGKPKDKEQAYDMLNSLSSRIHQVYTGVSIQCERQEIFESFYVETKVHMKAISDKEIYCYIATGDPMDKAGAYGIQTQGALLIDKIEGDYFNVVGLPISRLYEELKKIGAISI